MRRRKVIFGVLALVLCGVLAAVFWPKKEIPEPVYKGRKLSEWVNGLNRYPFHGEIPLDAERAIRDVGTNGIPLYLKWVGYEGRGPTKALYALFVRILGLPGSGKDSRQESLQGGAVRAFQILGESAESAIPALEECVTHSESYLARGAASRSLACIGGRGALAYASLMTNANSAIRMQTVSYSFLFTNAAIRDQAAKMVGDPDATVRSAATNALAVFKRNSTNSR